MTTADPPRTYGLRLWKQPRVKPGGKKPPPVLGAVISRHSDPDLGVAAGARHLEVTRGTIGYRVETADGRVSREYGAPEPLLVRAAPRRRRSRPRR